jgi:uncharacterized protein YyaL (SSP411 family)
VTAWGMGSAMHAGNRGPNRLTHHPNPWLARQSNAAVQWWPWGDAAFDEARRRDVPVLVASGHAACPLCREMERVCFDDPAIASVQNRVAVSVRLDRDEHPEIDRYLLDVCHLLRRAGGWPLQVFFTPDGHPFHAGTFFGPQRRAGRASWPEVLEAIDEGWKTRRAEVVEAARDLRIMAARIHANEPAPASSAWSVDAALDELRGRWDPVWGGFGEAPKFPSFPALALLIDGAARGRSGDRDHLDRTWRGMLEGGLHDAVGGGLFRYATDGRWQVPAFEKTLIDQAQFLASTAELLPHTLLPAYRLAESVRRSIDVIDQMYTDDPAGLSHTNDVNAADHRGYYSWSSDEREALGLVDSCDGLDWIEIGDTGVDPSVRFLPRVAWFAEGDTRWQHIRTHLDRLRDARAARHNAPEPDRRSFVLAHALTCSGLARAAIAFHLPTAAQRAREALEALRAWAWRRDGLLHAGAPSTDPGLLFRPLGHARLEDAASVIHAALDVAGATGESHWVAFASDVGDWLEAEFRREDGRLRATVPSDADPRIDELASALDDHLPSPVALATGALLRLSVATQDEERRARTCGTLAACGGAIERHGVACGALLLVRELATRNDGPTLLIELTPNASDPFDPLAHAHAAWPDLHPFGVFLHRR